MLSHELTVTLYTFLFTTCKLTRKHFIGFDSKFFLQLFHRILNATTMFTYCISKLNKTVKLLLALLQTHHNKN